MEGGGEGGGVGEGCRLQVLISGLNGPTKVETKQGEPGADFCYLGVFGEERPRRVVNYLAGQAQVFGSELAEPREDAMRRGRGEQSDTA